MRYRRNKVDKNKNRTTEPQIKKKSNITRMVLCALAGLIMAVNIKTFVHTGGLLPGGFSGVTLLIQEIFEKYLHFSIPYAPVYIALNAFPIVLGFMKIGRKFTSFSCITIAVVASFTDFIPSLNITQDILLIAVFGGLINGFAVSLCLLAGATSGGTDFISIYISEKYRVDAWNYILIFNACILLLAGLMFSWDRALYSIIFQYVSTQIINTSYKRYKKNTLFIVTEKPDEIAEIINSITLHGATAMKATGMYKHSEKTMLYSVVGSDEIKAVTDAIAKVDPEAFVNALRTDYIRGRYYMRPND
ncbi:MAG: YitT family protein [Lachnospiraceae bacterium]|nr:YitT family protein [Lachnospiraceae bacterium]